MQKAPRQHALLFRLMGAQTNELLQRRDSKWMRTLTWEMDRFEGLTQPCDV